MNIGKVKLKASLLLAPLAGFTDAGFRALCASYGAGLTCTEMVSAKGLCYNNKGTQDLLFTTDAEKIAAVQLFGHEPEFMFKAAKDERLAKFDILDINMGCPVKKIFGNGDGSALMQNPALISELVQAAKEGFKKSVTVKLRAGIELGKPLALECALAAQNGGADAVAVHPRFREQFYSGAADHSITREVKRTLKIPVIANGDIFDAESLARVKAQTGADGFMLARGALGRPYMFAELAGKKFEFNALEAVKRHMEILLSYLPQKTAANVMKLHLCHYAKGGGNAKAVRTAVSSAQSAEDILNIAEMYL
jgi:nifR3 family TIM-barrel protein